MDRYRITSICYAGTMDEREDGDYPWRKGRIVSTPKFLDNPVEYFKNPYLEFIEDADGTPMNHELVRISNIKKIFALPNGYIVTTRHSDYWLEEA